MDPNAQEFQPTGIDYALLKQAADVPVSPANLMQSEHLRKNSFTPRDKRLSNGPEHSSADKFPEDSPTRPRPPRFPLAMMHTRRSRAFSRAPEPPELNIEDKEAFPALEEAVKQPKKGKADSGDQDALTTKGEPAAITPENQPWIPVIDSEFSAARQRLAQQLSPTHAREGSVNQATSAQDRIPTHSQAALSSDHQLNQNYHQQSAQQHTPGLKQKEPQSSRSRFFPESLAGPVATPQKNQQKQPMQQPQPESLAGPVVTPQKNQQKLSLAQFYSQGSPIPGSSPSSMLTYGFNRLEAEQQAQRQATLSQLQSAFFDPQSSTQTDSARPTGSATPAAIPGLSSRQTTMPGSASSHQGHVAPQDASATFPGLAFRQKTVHGSASGHQEQFVFPEASDTILNSASSHQEHVAPQEASATIPSSASSHQEYIAPQEASATIPGLGLRQKTIPSSTSSYQGHVAPRKASPAIPGLAFRQKTVHGSASSHRGEFVPPEAAIIPGMGPRLGTRQKGYDVPRVDFGDTIPGLGATIPGLGATIPGLGATVPGLGARQKTVPSGTSGYQGHNALQEVSPATPGLGARQKIVPGSTSSYQEHDTPQEASPDIPGFLHHRLSAPGNVSSSQRQTIQRDAPIAFPNLRVNQTAALPGNSGLQGHNASRQLSTATASFGSFRQTTPTRSSNFRGRRTQHDIPAPISFRQQTAPAIASNLRGRNDRPTASTTIPGRGFHQQTAAAEVNTDLRAYLAQTGLSAPIPIPHHVGYDIPGYDNPEEYAPVFDTDTQAFTPTAERETAFTQADYQTSPPALSATMSELLEGSVAIDPIAPDPRPLSPGQETGARYGIGIGGIGLATLPDYYPWNPPKPWKKPAAGHNRTPTGWEWTENWGKK